MKEDSHDCQTCRSDERQEDSFRVFQNLVFNALGCFGQSNYWDHGESKFPGSLDKSG